MKILFLDQTAELGGGELSMLSEVMHLSHECVVFLFEDGPLRALLNNAAVPVTVAENPFGAIAVKKGSGFIAAMLSAPAVFSLVLEVARQARRFDLVYANSQKALMVGALASLLARRPLVWHLHDILDAAHFSASMRRLAVRVGNWRATRIIVNSRATGEAFSRLGGDASRISLGYQGIDEAPFAAVSPDEITRLRAELAPDGRPLIGVFGRLSAWKGQSVFIEAIANLERVVGVIVGGPLFGEEAYAAALKEKVTRLGMNDRVRFLGFRHDIPALMRSMDVIVHSSVAPEPFGRVVVEAMLAGKPVVASGAGGIFEIIENGRTGWLYAPGDAKALADTLNEVLNNHAQTAAVAAAGQAHARDNFSLAAAIRQVDAALQQVKNPASA